MDHDPHPMLLVATRAADAERLAKALATAPAWRLKEMLKNAFHGIFQLASARCAPAPGCVNQAVGARFTPGHAAPDGKRRIDQHCLKRIASGLARLRWQGIALLLLDARRPGARGRRRLAPVLAAARRLPVLLLRRAGTAAVAGQALRLGAPHLRLAAHLERHDLPRRAGSQHPAAHAQATLDSLGEAVLSTDLRGHVTYLNPAAERLTGWGDAQAHGRALAEVFRIVDGLSREPVPNPALQAIAGDAPARQASHCLLLRRDGSECAIEDSAAPLRDAAGSTCGAVIVFRDVTAARATAQHLAYLAHHDALTRLPNRLLLGDRIDNAIALARRHGNQGAVLFLDLDGFKRINDALGHQAGDRLLESVAQRLLGCVRGSDTVSRLGGDEFVVLLSEIQHPADAGRSAQKIVSCLAQPHRLGEREVRISVSIGISLFPEQADAATALIRCADAAMYHAKHAGPGNYLFFRQGMQAGARPAARPRQQAPCRPPAKKPRAAAPRAGRRCAD